MNQLVKTTPIMAYDEVDALFNMLSTCRPAWSNTEKLFIQNFIVPLIIPHNGMVDATGNHYCRIGDAPIMWSCHTDTVHHKEGEQTPVHIKDYLIGVKNSSCLGADDTAGVWLMTEMIRHSIPGLYIFHRAEEIGCVGSRWLVKNHPELVKGIKFAVALDRRNKDDIITKQMGSRCCSDEFAKSLGEQLEMGFKPSPHGSFTDTAHYVDLIGECTNLSVGYTGAHGPHEDLDCEFLFRLRDKLLKVDTTKLVEKRKPGEKEVYVPYKYEYKGNSHSGWGGESFSDDEWDSMYPRAGTAGWWDANGTYYHWDDDFDLDGHQIWDGFAAKGPNPNPVFGPALKREEMLHDRQRWWQKIYAKKPLYNRAPPQVSGGGNWFSKERQRQEAERHKRQHMGVTKMSSVKGKKRRKKRGNVIYTTHAEAFFDSKKDRVTLANLCRHNPEEVAAFLEEYAISADDITMYILGSGSAVRGSKH
jgi:hypothetical protein